MIRCSTIDRGGGRVPYMRCSLDPNGIRSLRPALPERIVFLQTYSTTKQSHVREGFSFTISSDDGVGALSKTEFCSIR